MNEMSPQILVNHKSMYIGTKKRKEDWTKIDESHAYTYKAVSDSNIIISNSQ